jgi:hypothetical protein
MTLPQTLNTEHYVKYITYHKIWYMIWYMIWCIIWYDIWYIIWYNMIYDMIWYMIYDDMIYLTAIGLTPGGSSAVNIYTQYRERNIHNNQNILNTHNYFYDQVLKTVCNFISICLNTDDLYSDTPWCILIALIYITLHHITLRKYNLIVIHDNTLHTSVRNTNISPWRWPGYMVETCRGIL